MNVYQYARCSLFPQIGTQAQLLLSKLLYCRGAYQEALDLLDHIDLHSLSLGSTQSRLFYIVAEAYAVKGK